MYILADRQLGLNLNTLHSHLAYRTVSNIYNCREHRTTMQCIHLVHPPGCLCFQFHHLGSNDLATIYPLCVGSLQEEAVLVVNELGAPCNTTCQELSHPALWIATSTQGLTQPQHPGYLHRGLPCVLQEFLPNLLDSFRPFFLLIYENGHSALGSIEGRLMILERYIQIWFRQAHITILDWLGLMQMLSPGIRSTSTAHRRTPRLTIGCCMKWGTPGIVQRLGILD